MPIYNLLKSPCNPPPHYRVACMTEGSRIKIIVPWLEVALEREALLQCLSWTIVKSQMG